MPVPNDVGTDTSVRVADTDPSGRYVLGYISGPYDGDERGLLWVDGELQTRLAGAHASEPDTHVNFSQVNSSGVVVGVTEIGNADSKPWKYENGETTTLPGANWLLDINENGDILGTISNERTMVWVGGAPDERHELRGDATGTGMSDQGVVVGGDGGGHYWPDLNSTPQALENPAGVESAYPWDVAGDWAIGYSNDGSAAGVRWNLADGTVEGLPYGVHSVNSDGDVVTSDALHRTDGSTFELPAPDGSNTTSVVEITERGTDVVSAGSYEISDNIERPLTWTC